MHKHLTMKDLMSGYGTCLSHSFFFSSRRRHTRSYGDWSSDVCSSDLPLVDTMVGDLRPMLIIVLSATALLLVLACVNVTNLLLARASRRSREVAIRAAVGRSEERRVGKECRVRGVACR